MNLHGGKNYNFIFTDLLSEIQLSVQLRMQATKLFIASTLKKYFKVVNFVYFEKKNKMNPKC